MRAKRTEQRKDAGMRTKRVHRRGSRRAEQRPSWIGCLRRLNRVLSSSSRMIASTKEALDRASEHATECPMRTSRDLRRLSAGLQGAMNRLQRAVRGIRETMDSMLCEPHTLSGAPWLLTDAAARWLMTAIALENTSREIFELHQDLAHELLSGELMPERVTAPRIVVVPRLISARDFLLCRRKSAYDRITPIPLRRRRTACRATTDAPRRISRGRAPPSVSNALL